MEQRHKALCLAILAVLAVALIVITAWTLIRTHTVRIPRHNTSAAAPITQEPQIPPAVHSEPLQGVTILKAGQSVVICPSGIEAKHVDASKAAGHPEQTEAELDCGKPPAAPPH